MPRFAVKSFMIAPQLAQFAGGLNQSPQRAPFSVRTAASVPSSRTWAASRRP
ncbi:MAG: hypothetical protein ACR2MP_34965 [Streptosporangiaceae bacterium]